MLTKNDIKALKTCDSLVFRYSNNQSRIEAIKEVKNDPWETEKRYIINVNTEKCSNYIKEATTHIYNNTIWKTITEILKENDTIYLQWYPDAHTNQYMEKAGLHGDVLYLKIFRQGKNKNKWFTFLIDTCTCPDNSARMIKLAPKEERNLYWYELTCRPIGIGCQPDGWVRTDNNRGQFGAVGYKEPLTEEQIKHFSLKQISYDY